MRQRDGPQARITGPQTAHDTAMDYGTIDDLTGAGAALPIT